jgi:hypothetical protein
MKELSRLGLTASWLRPKQRRWLRTWAAVVNVRKRRTLSKLKT